ncbi:DUF3817 domain-containing protein [Nocardia veterana]|uniref:DUF3817 domain-containing protein n=1 Tax=Nocardia veterana TaxID=132249 RepID=A0A7X6M2H8_9NOCA|nr:DUF3817 domain-containing protein [Nocardia veterana]
MSADRPTTPAATSTPASAPAPAARDTGRIRSALTRYRVFAYITGVWLLLLCAEMVYKYLLLDDSSTAPHWLFYVGQIHGIFYMLYLVFTIDLGIKTRWKPLTLVITALAGTIPFLSFVCEHYRTRQVRAEWLSSETSV